MPGTPRPPFDARPLTGPVDKADVRAYAAATSGSRGRLGATRVIALTAIGVAALFAVVPQVAGAVSRGLTNGSIALLAFAAIAVVVFALDWIAHRRNREVEYRLHRFAQANGMEFLPDDADPQLPGVIFGLGSSRHATRRVRGIRPRFVEFADYRYTTGSGKRRRTHAWGYVAIALDAPLPHMMLDAKGNNGLFGSNLPATFSGGQRLSLEGDFDEFFSLYCPAGYETDALYLFTPDVMARLMDHAAQLDIEIVDDWLFLYAKRDLVSLDPDTWAWLFSVVSALLDKIRRWERWRDERLQAPTAAHAPPAHGPTVPFPADPAAPAPVPPTAPPARLKGVAREGRRLDRGFPWSSVITLGALAVAVLAVVFWP